MLVALDDDLFEVPSPSLLALAERRATRHRPDHALDALEEIERHCDSVSRSFVELFLGEVWKPFAQADMPAERWPGIEDAVGRLPPVASEALMAIFAAAGRRWRAPSARYARRVSGRGRAARA